MASRLWCKLQVLRRPDDPLLWSALVPLQSIFIGILWCFWFGKIDLWSSSTHWLTTILFWVAQPWLGVSINTHVRKCLLKLFTVSHSYTVSYKLKALIFPWKTFQYYPVLIPLAIIVVSYKVKNSFFLENLSIRNRGRILSDKLVASHPMSYQLFMFQVA